MPRATITGPRCDTARPRRRPGPRQRRRARPGPRTAPHHGGETPPSRNLPPRRPRPFRRPRGAAGRHFRQGDGVVAVAAAAGEREGAQEPPPLPPPRGRALRHRHLAPLPRRQVRRDGVRCGAVALPAGVARRPSAKHGSRARRAACVRPGGGRAPRASARTRAAAAALESGLSGEGAPWIFCWC